MPFVAISKLSRLLPVDVRRVWPLESFFGTIKTELLYRQTRATRHDAELAIFAWIEGWYNPERIMNTLGMRSRDQYEAAFQEAQHHSSHDTPVMVGSTESGPR